MNKYYEMLRNKYGKKQISELNNRNSKTKHKYKYENKRQTAIKIHINRNNDWTG